MNNARLHALEDGQTGIAKKVLSAVPITELWQFHQIAAEITRLTGSRIEKRLITGCLQTLKDSGLIREPVRGSFQRINQKAKPPELVVIEEDQMEANPLAARTIAAAKLNKDRLRKLEAVRPQDMEAFDRLSWIAGFLRVIADLVEDSALQLQSDVEKASAGSGKLLQLKELLKSI